MRKWDLEMVYLDFFAAEIWIAPKKRFKDDLVEFHCFRVDDNWGTPRRKRFEGQVIGRVDEFWHVVRVIETPLLEEIAINNM